MREGLELSSVLIADTSLPTAMNHKRLIQYMERNEFNYFASPNGNLCGTWDRRWFTFSLDEQNILQVQTRWPRSGNIDRLEAMLEACNFWNASRIWPKAYVRVDDEGTVVVFVEQNLLLANGVTDRQLDELLDCALATALGFAEYLDQTFPDPLLGGTL